MKTNIVVSSKDRVLFGVVIPQQTQNEFLSLSKLQDAFDSVRVQNGWGMRRVDWVLNTTEFKERVYFILLKQGFINDNFLTFMKTIENQGIINTLKELGVYKTMGRGANKQTWCNPYIWAMIAMEMNPQIYAEVVCWLTDRLIMDRIEAGDLYKELTNSLSTFNIESYQYSNIAIRINEIVFGKHYAGIRNVASSSQLKEIKNIEIYLANLIRDGFIADYKGVTKFLDRMYVNKNK